jgi:hypothetical protein
VVDKRLWALAPAQVGQVDMDNSSRQMARHVQIQQVPLHCVQKTGGK